MSEAKLQLPKDVMLRMENMHLKLQNVQLQLQVLQQELGKAMDVRSQLQKGMEEIREEIKKDYNVDIAVAKIDSDGTVVSG